MGNKSGRLTKAERNKIVVARREIKVKGEPFLTLTERHLRKVNYDSRRTR